MALSWTPIRKGKTYCAPACGNGCTHAEYMRVVKSAEKLAKKCGKEIGGKWKTRVHENLGWHYSVYLENTGISISYGGYRGLGGDYYDVGFSGGTPSVVSLHPQTFKSPKEAFDAQIDLINQEAKKWNFMISQIKKAIK